MSINSSNPLTSGDVVAIKSWLFDHALPLWASHGMDRTHGGVHEALAFDRTPAPHPKKRLRVLARQIYVYCHAHVMGWDGNAEETVKSCFDTLMSTGWHRDGGFIHLFHPDGTVQNDARDTYDQCFCVLAFAWMIKAGIHAQQARTALNQTIAFFDAQLIDPIHGGLIEGVGIHENSPRRANPHMHYFEAMLACHSATGDTTWLDRAGSIVDLFDKHFFDPTTGTLTEFFAADWSRLTGIDEKWHRVEPGHHYEWCWLLMTYLERRDHPGLADKARLLFSTARAMGHHAVTGAAADTMASDGTAISETARCWPQTEALKAAVAMERHGLDAAPAFKLDMIAVLFAHYLDQPVKGGWYDSRDAKGQVAAPDMPSSTFYHVYCALAEYLGER